MTVRGPWLREVLPSALPSAADPLGMPADGRFSGYELDAAFDEMFEATGQPRPQCRALLDELLSTSPQDLRARQVEADRAFLAQGITFTVYGDDQGTERIF